MQNDERAEIREAVPGFTKACVSGCNGINTVY